MKRKQLRLLAIDLTAKGFGYALIEKRRGLLDWGFSTLTADDEDGLQRRIGKRMERGRPTVLVMESVPAVAGRANALRRSEALMRMASERHLGTCFVSRTVVRRVLGAETKTQIARLLAEHFPELRSRLPPKRQRWMNEDERMHIFDALSLAVAVLGLPSATAESQSSL